MSRSWSKMPPSPELLTEMGIVPPDTLNGLYQGVPLPEREWAHGNTLPDRITIYQRPIVEDCDDDDVIIRAIGETVIHEVRAPLRSQRGGDRGDRVPILARRNRSGRALGY